MSTKQLSWLRLPQVYNHKFNSREIYQALVVDEGTLPFKEGLGFEAFFAFEEDESGDQETQDGVAQELQKSEKAENTDPWSNIRTTCKRQRRITLLRLPIFFAWRT